MLFFTYVIKFEIFPQTCIFTRRWVARKFTVWRTHTRTLIIVSHALAHRTSFFDDRTRTRTRTFFYEYI